MPYVSNAQRKKFNVDPKLRKYAPEYNAASKGMKLPEHVSKKKKGPMESMFGKRGK